MKDEERRAVYRDTNLTGTGRGMGIEKGLKYSAVGELKATACRESQMVHGCRV